MENQSELDMRCWPPLIWHLWPETSVYRCFSDEWVDMYGSPVMRIIFIFSPVMLLPFSLCLFVYY